MAHTFASDLVTGYLRGIVARQDIPNDILDICVAFYVPIGYFTDYGDSYILDRNRLIIKKRDDSDASAFGSNAVHSMSGRIYLWKFRVLHSTPMRTLSFMRFGITDYWDIDVNRNFFDAEDTNNYAVEGNVGGNGGSRLRHRELVGFAYPFSIKSGTVVTMELNLKEKQLIFHIDNQCLGPAFGAIKCGEDIRYKMAISFGFSQSAVELLEFEELS